MGTSSTAKTQQAHTRKPGSRSSMAPPKEPIQAQPRRPKTKKKPGSAEPTGKKPPKNMHLAQADKIRANEELWGVRLVPEGLDPNMAAEDPPPSASIIDFSGGESTSYPMSMDHAFCGRSLGPEDVDPNQKPRCIPQPFMTRGVPIVREAAPGGYRTFPDSTFPVTLPPNPPNFDFFDSQFLDPRRTYKFSSISCSPQPSEHSEVGSESNSSAYSYFVPSANGGHGGGWLNGESPVGAPSLHIPMGELSLSPTGSAGMPPLSMQHFQDDWSGLPDYAIPASSQDPQVPASFTLDSADASGLQLFTYPPSGLYAAPNIAMASQNISHF